MITETNPSLPEVINSHLVKSKNLTLHELERLVKQLEISPEVSRAKNLSTLVSNLCNTYICSCLAERYGRIDSNVFSLTRNVLVSWDDGKYELIPELQPEPSDWKKVETRKYIKSQPIPLLWEHTPSIYETPNPRISTGLFEAPLKRSDNFRIKARFPIAVTSEEWMMYYQAKAIYYRCMASFFGNSNIAVYMNGSGSNYFPTPRLEAYWIPKLEDLTIEPEPIVNPDDPALVVRFGSERFLLKLWDTVHEDPITQIMKEFSL